MRLPDRSKELNFSIQTACRAIRAHPQEPVKNPVKKVDQKAFKLLQELVCHGRLSKRERSSKLRLVTNELITVSPHFAEPNFHKISNSDLSLLFELYDYYFFENMCGRLTRSFANQFSFRLSQRMTNAGGKTTREQHFDTRSRVTHTDFEIAVSTTLLFETFRRNRDKSYVGGLECPNRLTALLRIMEHEIVHLIEMLLWDDSSCAKTRFKSIIWRFFGHIESNHQLSTPMENARRLAGIEPGDRVKFAFDGRQVVGFVNRITRRATILVRDATGVLYDDGHKYKKFYVPIGSLRKVG